MKIYIAYGSNMSAAQMARRCPDAKLITAGWLDNHTLEFYLHATVEPSKWAEDRVPVLIWEISDRDEASLDRYEGVPHYYTKETATVHGTDGNTYTGLIYIMNKDMQRMSMPDKSYVDGIQSAYRALGFAAELRNLQAAVTRMANRCRYIAPGSRSMFLDKTYQ